MSNYNDDLSAIRQMMERSSRFMSLSGASGILAGIYSFIGAYLAYHVLYSDSILDDIIVTSEERTSLIYIGVGVILFTAITSIALSARKAGKLGEKAWSSLSARLILNLAIPLVTGGVAAIFLINEGYYSLLAPFFLIFYGLALVNASNFTLGDVRWLGLLEILLGITCFLKPEYGLLFWALGFGLLHVIYGVVMYIKYDRKG